MHMNVDIQPIEENTEIEPVPLENPPDATSEVSATIPLTDPDDVDSLVAQLPDLEIHPADDLNLANLAHTEADISSLIVPSTSPTSI